MIQAKAATFTGFPVSLTCLTRLYRNATRDNEMNFMADLHDPVSFDNTPLVISDKVLKSSVSSGIALCSALKINRRIGRKYRFHLQCRRMNQTRSKREAGN
jgi:ethanolamine ammonia-lyase large subunit